MPSFREYTVLGYWDGEMWKICVKIWQAIQYIQVLDTVMAKCGKYI